MANQRCRSERISKEVIASKENGIAFIHGRPRHRPEDPTVIFLHGSGLAAAFWHRQVDELADRMNTVAIDLPGHGLSDKPALKSVRALAAVVMQFAKMCGYSQIIPCGLSLGGAITLQMLLDYPETLAGGILVGTGARLRVRPEIFDLIAGDYPGFVAATGSMAASSRTPAGALTLAQELTAACPPEVTMSDYRACDRFDVMARLPEIHLPVEVICGADDLLTPLKYSDYLTQHITNARQAVIPQAGHLAPIEQPAAVNATIRTFVAQVFAR
jgi:pimeloyl-ACP methyl ester carboxylesterase